MLVICINNITLGPPNDGLFLLPFTQDTPDTILGQTADTDVRPPLGGEVRQQLTGKPSAIWVSTGSKAWEQKRQVRMGEPACPPIAKLIFHPQTWSRNTDRSEALIKTSPSCWTLGGSSNLDHTTYSHQSQRQRMFITPSGFHQVVAHLCGMDTWTPTRICGSVSNGHLEIPSDQEYNMAG